jgi:hypothetical protein
MPVARKRPCCICHRWFRPDNRVGSRQRACNKPECQSLRRQKKQAAWRAANPDYFTARRIQARMGVTPAPEPLRLPSPLDQLPWDIAQSQFGVQGADFIGVMGTLLLRSAQSQFPGYGIDSKRDPDALPPVVLESQMTSGADWSGAGGGRDAAGITPT